MNNYYWKLEPYKGQNSRFRCPNCGKGRQYTRFINSKGEYAPYEYGKCNREAKCGYFNYPNGIKSDAPVIVPKEEPIEFISWDKYNFDLDLNSSFIKAFIDHTQDEDGVFRVLKKYFVRTDGDFMIYPFIDDRNRLTYVKKMYYRGFNRYKYTYKAIKEQKGRFKQCLFGLHLLTNYSINCVVESEKTALVCAYYYPEFAWMATGGSNMIKKAKVLKTAHIFPDKGKAFTKWQDILGTDKYFFSTTVENSDLPDGSDLADYLLKN